MGIRNDLTTRTKPPYKALLSESRREPFHRHNGAPGHEPRERRAAFAKQHPPNAGMHAVGTNQQIAMDRYAVLQQ
jgi:hypothetical protein